MTVLVLACLVHNTNLDLCYLKYNLVCVKYYGMGIEDAWSLGYSGKGVKVAVTDIGINTDLEDLEHNIVSNNL